MVAGMLEVVRETHKLLRIWANMQPSQNTIHIYPELTVWVMLAGSIFDSHIPRGATRIGEGGNTALKTP